MKNRLTSLFAAALLAVAGHAAAHDDATLDKMTAPNGGQLRMAGAYHLELVLVKDSKTARENPVFVYLTDHADKPLATKGMKARLSLLGGGGKGSVELTPDGDNRFKGVATYASSPDLKAVVSLTDAEGKTAQARFTPLASTKAPASKGHGGHSH